MKKILTTMLFAMALCVNVLATQVTIGDVWKKNYPGLGRWDVVLTAADNENWKFTFEIVAPTSGFVNGHVYSATGGLNDLMSDYVDFVSADYMETNGADGSVSIAANVVLTDGRDFQLVYGVAPKPTATDTIDVLLPHSTMRQGASSLGDPVLVFSGVQEQYAVSLSFLGVQPKVSYAMEDVYDYFTSLRVGGQEVIIRDLDATLQVSGQNFALDAYLLGEDAHCYHTMLSYEVPMALDTAYITATNMLIDESGINQFGQIVYSASTSTMIVELLVYTDSKYGHFVGTDIDLENSFISSEGSLDEYHLLSGDITIVQEGNITHLTGGVLVEDTVYYVLDLQYTRPTAPTRTMNLSVSNATLDVSRISEEGVVYMVGYDSKREWYVSVMLYTNGETGVFYTQQTDGYDTYVAPMNGVDDVFDLLEDTLMVTLEDDELSIQGTLFLQSELDPTDAPLVYIDMWAYCQTGRALDNSEEDFEAYMERYVMDASMAESDGFITLDATNADSTKMAALVFHVAGTHETIGIPAGEYRIDDSGLPGTVAVAPNSEGGQLYPSFAAMCRDHGEPTVPLWYLEEGTVTVENRGGQLFVEVNALNSFERKVHVVIAASPKDTTAVHINDCELLQYESEFQFFGPNRDYEAYVTMEGASVVGTYDWSQMNHDYTRIRLKGTEYAGTHSANAVVTESDNGYHVEAFIINEDAHCYQIAFDYYNEPSTWTKTANLGIAHMVCDSVWADLGEWLTEGTGEQYGLQLTLRGDSYVGTFDGAHVDWNFTLLTELASGALLHFVDGEITSTADHLSGWLLGKDGVRYELNAAMTLPIESVETAQPARKYLRNGQIYLQVGDSIFDILGRKR